MPSRRAVRYRSASSCVVGDGDRCPVGVSYCVQHQEVAERLGHVDAEGDRGGVLDLDRLGRAGLERRHDRCAAGGLHTDEPGQVTLDPSERAELDEGLVDPDQSDATAGGVDDHVRHPPAELLHDLEPHRLLALDPVRLLERGHVEPVVVAGRDRGRNDQRPASEINPSTRCRSAPVTTVSARVIVGASSGMTTVVRRPGASGVRRPGGTGVAIGRHRQPACAELLGARHPDRCTTRLERTGRQQPVVLDQHPVESEVVRQSGNGKQRRHPLAEGHDMLGR